MTERDDDQERRYPRGFDPARDVLLDVRSLRGMAHPLRPQILGLLRAEGPLTATRVAERLGESSAAASYHLRQLATYGFVEEDEERGTGRERWWRAVHERTWFDQELLRTPPPDTDPGEVSVLAEDYLRHAADLYAQKMHRWLDNRDSLSREWIDASTMSDTMLQLTAEEVQQLAAELQAVVDRYRKAGEAGESGAPRDARVVNAQYQVFPQFLPGDTGHERG